ncbi:MAG: ComEA family DNA-binding protein [Fibrobacterota bacterium]
MIRKGWIGLWVSAAVLWTLAFFPRNTSSTEIEILETGNTEKSAVYPDSLSNQSSINRCDSTQAIGSPKKTEDKTLNVDRQASCINVNTADATQLQALSGVGPVIAKRIIAYREGHKKFAKPDDLTAVKGIGPVTVEKNRNIICF